MMLPFRALYRRIVPQAYQDSKGGRYASYMMDNTVTAAALRLRQMMPYLRLLLGPLQLISWFSVLRA